MSETVKYPNAGPGADLGRYRTGEVPAKMDVAEWHGEPVSDGEYPEPVIGKRQVSAVGLGCVVVPDDAGELVAIRAARFDLISRATPAPAVAAKPETGVDLQSNPNCGPGHWCHGTCARHGRCMYVISPAHQITPAMPAAEVGEAGIGQTLISRLKDFTAALESGDGSKFRVTRVRQTPDGLVREQIPFSELTVVPVEYRPGYAYGEVPADCHVDYCPCVGDRVVRLLYPDETPTEIRSVAFSRRRELVISPDDEHPIIAWLIAKDCRLISRAQVNAEAGTTR